jgi:hypothetical protein
MSAEILAPAVDDAFWFEKSKEIVDNALSRRDKAAETLCSLIAWLSSLYTGCLWAFSSTRGCRGRSGTST